nr:hypothetical protein [Nostoc sp. CmiSLP01]MDZ8287103.1 hypothetical protein [Nostoc sp. ChiSLP01]
MLVIEAKQSDLGRGFTQLAVELIALDQWTRSETPILYGVVTTGEDWLFEYFTVRINSFLKILNFIVFPNN